MRQEESEAFGSRYTLGPLVGRGAMGRVHRASVTNEDAPVAVKLLRDDLASEPEVIGRFLQESHLLRSVHHPNVVGIHDLVAETRMLTPAGVFATRRLPASACPEHSNANVAAGRKPPCHSRPLSSQLALSATSCTVSKLPFGLW